MYGAVAQMGVGLLGEYLSNMDKATAKKLLQKALDEYGKIDIPTLEQLVAEEVGPSAFEDIKADPKLRDAQMQGLDRLGEMIDGDGFALEDRATMNRIGNQVSRRAAGGRATIANQFAQRGALSSGAELSMQMKNQQDSNEAASQAGLDAGAQALRRRFDAILSRGRMAGDIRGQEFSEKARVADARDAIARQNAAARQNARGYNVRLGQQDYENRLRRAGGMSGQYTNQASQANGQAGDTRDFYAGLGAAANEAVSSSEREERRRREKNRYGDDAKSDPNEWENPFGGY